MWQIGAIITCVFLLEYDFKPEPEQREVDARCEIKQIYFDPSVPKEHSDSYAFVDCSSDFNSKRLTKSLYNDPFRVVFKSDKTCF